MFLSLGVFLALIAAVTHCIYTLSMKYNFNKRAADPLAFAFWVNIGVGVCATACIPFCEHDLLFNKELILYVLPVSILYVIGNTFLVISFKAAPASVAGPLLGVKVFFAALVSVFLVKEPVSGWIWAGAVLAMPAVTLVNYEEGEPWSIRSLLRLRNLPPVLAALAYAHCDGFAKLAVNHFQGVEGVKFALFAHCYLIMGAMTLFFLLFIGTKKPRTVIAESPRLVVWVVLVNFATLMLFFYALAMTANIAVVNILYSSRAALIVPMAFLAVKILHHPIDKLTPRTLRMRLAGGFLMFIAICTAILCS